MSRNVQEKQSAEIMNNNVQEKRRDHEKKENPCKTGWFALVMSSLISMTQSLTTFAACIPRLPSVRS